jgi:hypothetical protein
VHITGDGAYDWVVRSAAAGPELDATATVVHMDSGPITEAPDTVTIDLCSDPFTSSMNTWENLFFDVYRSRFQAQGFRVDGWTVVGGAEAWAAGGVVAETEWSGRCASTTVLDCSDTTTFRLIAVVTGTAPEATVGPVGGAISTAGPAASPPATASGAPESAVVPGTSPGLVPASPGAVACADLGCLASPPMILVGLGLGAVVIGGGVFLRFRGAGRTGDVLPAKVEPPTLDGSAAPDTPMTELTLDASGDGLEIESAPPGPDPR